MPTPQRRVRRSSARVCARRRAVARSERYGPGARQGVTVMAPYSPSDLPTACQRLHHRFGAQYPTTQARLGIARVRRRATSPTSTHATWAHCFAELPGSEVFAEPGFEGVVGVSRPSNDPGHASRCASNHSADAPQSCSCRTVKLPMALSPPTSSQRSLRHAWGRSVTDAPPPTTHFGQSLEGKKLQIMAGSR
jgi:hypothetical protein